MKKVLIAILMLTPALSWAATKPAPNPADYTVTVHVQSSQLTIGCFGPPSDCSAGHQVQHLAVVVDGKKYELESEFENYLLRVGDYKARIYAAPTNRPGFEKNDTPNAYEYRRNYEFLFPDGQTRVYMVMGESE